MTIPIRERHFDYAWWRDLGRYYNRQLWDHFDPGIWEASVERANAPGVSHLIDQKTTELLVSAIDIAAQYPSPYLDAHLHLALDYGATIRELYEVMDIVGEFEGAHAHTDGSTAIVRVMLERDRLGEPYAESDPSRDGAASVSPLATGQVGDELLAKYDPARLAATMAWREKALAVREIDPKTQQFIVLAISTVLKLAQRSFEGQVEKAWELGCSDAEIIEAIMTAGWLEGMHAAEHGLIAFDAAKQRQ